MTRRKRAVQEDSFSRAKKKEVDGSKDLELYLTPQEGGADLGAVEKTASKRTFPEKRKSGKGGPSEHNSSEGEREDKEKKKGGDFFLHGKKFAGCGEGFRLLRSGGGRVLA